MKVRINFELLLVLLSSFLTHTNAHFRIINGQDINIEESPHTVAIFYQGYYICVGSLVNMNSVVTILHCVIGKEWNKLGVVAGVTDMRQIVNGIGQGRYVQHIHHDCAYDPDTKFMDIAVIKLYGSFQDNNAVKSIELCNDQLLPGKTIKVSGWGKTSVNSAIFSCHLQTKDLDIVDTQACKTAYAQKPLPVNIAETIICAGNSLEDVWLGDSGAAGVLNGRLCAVVQGGCFDPNVPNLYTDVTNARVRDFIISKMN